MHDRCSDGQSAQPSIACAQVVLAIAHLLVAHELAERTGHTPEGAAEVAAAAAALALDLVALTDLAAYRADDHEKQKEGADGEEVLDKVEVAEERELALDPERVRRVWPRREFDAEILLALDAVDLVECENAACDDGALQNVEQDGDDEPNYEEADGEEQAAFSRILHELVDAHAELRERDRHAAAGRHAAAAIVTAAAHAVGPATRRVEFVGSVLELGRDAERRGAHGWSDFSRHSQSMGEFSRSGGQHTRRPGH